MGLNNIQHLIVVILYTRAERHYKVIAFYGSKYEVLRIKT